MIRLEIVQMIAVEVAALAGLQRGSAMTVEEGTALIGESRVLKSHDLVVLMLSLEDRFAERGRTLEWPVQLHRTLATVGSLADFLEKQL